MNPKSRLLMVSLILVGAVLLSAGCRKEQANTADSAQPSPSKPQASPLVGFAKDLQFIKDGQYTYIWVLSRKDGKPFDPSDKEFLRTNAPQIVDSAMTDDKMKVIVGTNFNFEEGNIDLLKKRYVMEDYSGR